MHDHVCSDANKGLGDAKVAEFDDGVVRVLVEEVSKTKFGENRSGYSVSPEPILTQKRTHLL